MLVLLGIIVLCAAGVVLFPNRHVGQFGYMNGSWVAEHRASKQT